jgi:hypothetical protein
MAEAKTTQVDVTFRLLSNLSGPPFNIADCSGVIYLDDGSQRTWSGWTRETLGNPQASGAVFNIFVQDTAASPVGAAAVLNWVLTFMKRPGTRDASPFATNENTVTGSGATGAGGKGLLLDIDHNVKVKNSGTWDWGLLLQIETTPNDSASIKCFASDPEMEVGPGSSIKNPRK